MGNFERIKPFLRWAGGKSQSVRYLIQLIPTVFSEYYEAFLGAASLYFSLDIIKAVISDNNPALIRCYLGVKDFPEKTFEILQSLINECTENQYYKIRSEFNNKTISENYKFAAIFIYLNKTCFNGIWRVNQKGEFNVPYGFKINPPFPSKELLISASQHLKKADIISGDYREITKNAKSNDFLYFDPPYPQLKPSSFIHYTKEKFNDQDHYKLSEHVKYLHKKGCKILISNSDLPQIRNYYPNKEGFYHFPINVTYMLGANGSRDKINELAITNYPVNNTNLLLYRKKA